MQWERHLSSQAEAEEGKRGYSILAPLLDLRGWLWVCHGYMQMAEDTRCQSKLSRIHRGHHKRDVSTQWGQTRERVHPNSKDGEKTVHTMGESTVSKTCEDRAQVEEYRTKWKTQHGEI